MYILTTNQIFICQILEKKWKYNGTVHELTKTSRKPMAQDRSTLYNILMIVRIVKMCLNETKNKVL